MSPHDPAYVDLAARCERLDRRHTRYRFDLERDVPWDALDAPGGWFGPTYLEALGLDAASLDSDTRERLQWALGLAACEAFHALEALIVRFAAEERAALGPTRSLEALCLEEEKHMALFARYGEHLRRRRPDLAEALARACAPSAGLLGHLHEREDYPRPAAYHYLFWVNTVFFEEYTVWLDACLDQDPGIQPAWRAVHAVHRQEEVQHVATDAAYLDALNLSEAERYHLSKVFLLRLEDGFDRFFGVEAALRVAAPEQADALLARRRFRDLPLFRLLLEDPAFKVTRRAAPCIAALARRADASAERAALPGAPALLRGAPLPPCEPATLPEVLARAPADAALTYVGDDGAEQGEDLAALRRRATRALAGLRRAGARPGQAVLLVLPHPGELVGALWGCFLGGFVAVPLGRSLRRRIDEDRELLTQVRARTGDPLLVAEDDLLADLADEGWSTCRAAGIFEAPEGEAWHAPRPDDPALIQFSSGSTGSPRGVVLTHANLLANMRAAAACLEASAADVMLSWLPLHHDMGLSYHLTATLVGARQVLLTPVRFARRPVGWLEELSARRATASAGPNFAYAQVLRRLRPGQLEGLDLSRVRCLLSGAEPVSLELVERFERTLAPAGLAAGVVRPAYGLAEATCAVTIAAGDRRRAYTFDRDGLEDPAGAEQVPPEHPRAATFAGLGGPVPGVELRVLGPRGPLPSGVVGEVCVRGPSVASALLDERGRTPLLDDEGWLRTGDLGLIAGSELVLTGRAKDVVFVAGRNLFASDLEEVVRAVPGVRADRVAVVGCTDPASGLEQVVPVVGLARRGGRSRGEVVAAVAERLGEALAYPVTRVVVLPPEFFPRTTSGKLQRHRLRAALERGELDAYAIAALALGESGRLARQASGEWAALREGPAPTAPPAGPAGWLEQVRAVWAEALDLSPGEVGLDRSFFALGGDSLLAVEVHALLEERCGRRLDVSFLRDCRTVRETADYLLRALSAPAAPAAPRPAARAGGVAVVAMAGRFPGAPDTEALWDLLRAGRVATGTVPAERWDAARYHDPDPRAPGKTVCTSGGFLAGIKRFDPGAFGLSLEEARQTDPQQRIFLEVAAEALARAGARTRRVGVFAGAGGNEYFQRHATRPTYVTAETAAASLDHMLAARVAQRLGLTGPAITLDAACATSLVAVHQACRSLLAGECELAVAGGVQLNLTVLPFLLFSQAGVLSPSGRCRPFCADADGFVPGEAAGAVVLKPLEAALRDHDPILGVIRGSAVNNDGGSLSPLAPNPAGQREVLEHAYREAGIDPASLDYVEAHGTGTPVGDPVEVRALGQVLAGAAPGSVGLGSIKANLGHTLHAAGVASLIKVLLSLQHDELPPAPGAEASVLPAAAGPLALLSAARPWVRRADRPRRAGVNAFGIGGTNCHLIVEEPPARRRVRPRRDAHLLCFSAPDAAGLARLGAAHVDALALVAPVDLDRYCASANAAARRFGLRRAAALSRPEGARAALEPGDSPPRPTRGSPRLVFLLPGPGSQFGGMARHLLDTEPVVQEALAACARALDPLLPTPLLDLLREEAAPGAAAMDRIECSQPVVFALSYALGRWLEHLGVRPDALIGHSAGEYAAAALAGVWSLDEAARLVTRRGQHMARTEPGSMAAVLAPEEDVRPHLGEGVGVAALNEPRQVVISGRAAAVVAALARLAAAGIEARRLSISCAAHSTLMDPARRAFAADLSAAPPPGPPQVPIYSTLIGARVATFARGYWSDHLRAPVRFAGAVRAALADGHRCFVELGASAALSHCVEEVARAWSPEVAAELTVVPLLRRSLPGWAPSLAALGRLFERGVDLDLARLDGPARRHPLSVPAYPYARDEVWLEPPPLEEGGAGPALAPQRERTLSLENAPVVRDHRVHGLPIAPAALLLDHVLGALSLRHGGCALDDVLIGRPLALEPGVLRRVRVREREDGTLSLESRSEGGAEDAPWAEHLTARYTPLRRSDDWGAPEIDLAAARARCAEELPVAALYAQLEAGGLAYGPTVRTVAQVWRGEGEALARLVLPAEPDGGAHRLHPGLVDGAMQTTAALTLGAVLERATFLGFAIGRVAVQSPVAADCYAHVRLRGELAAGAEVLRCAVTLLSSAGAVLASFEDVCLKRFRPSARAGLSSQVARFHEPGWEPVPAPAGAPRLPGSASVTLLGARSPLRTALEREVEAAGGVALPEAPPARGAALPRSLSAPGASLLWIAPELEALGHVAQQLARAGSELQGFVAVSDDPGVWGFLRSLDHERPRWGCRSLTLDPGAPAALARAIVHELARPATHRLLRLEADAPPRAQVLRPVARPEPAAVDAALRPRGVYWVAGGLGGIGLAVAEALASRTGARLLLTGRRPHADAAALDRIARAGGEALYVPADVTDPAALRRALEVAREAWGEVHGVVHAAGVLNDAPVEERTPERTRAVWDPKLAGAEALAEATAAEDLDWFAVCSSLSALAGVPGQTDYAAANGALDAFAARLRRGRTRVVSLLWGPWRDVGMVKDERYQRGFLAQGLRPLGPLAGGEAFLEALALEGRHLVVSDVDPAREAALLRGLDRPAAAREVARARASGAADASPLRAYLLTRLAQHLHCAPEDLDADLPFSAQGVDSLMAVTLVRDLEQRCGLKLHPTLLFELPSANALLAHLEALAPQEPSVPPASPKEPPKPDPGGAARTVTEVPGFRAPGYWVIVGQGLQREDVPIGAPGPGEVEVEVHAAGVNFIDLLGPAGLHPTIRDQRFVPGHEVAGVVARVGAEVRDLEPGARVMALVKQGGYAARVVAPRASVLRLPAGFDFAQGAAVVVTGLTAVACIEEAGRVVAGERVLVQAAAGATGLACVQLALHHGARVLGTASAPAKLERLGALGVEHAIDYRAEPFDDAVRRLTGGEGVDVVVDSLSGDAIPRGLALLRPGGRFVEIGAAGVVEAPPVDPTRLFLADQTFATVNVGRLDQSPARLAARAARLEALLREGVIRPEVGHVLPFAEAEEAHRLLRERRNLGKVVLVVRP
ncbi:MAG: SDR family NAD(P)-dependent oxidoreductase [Planctomycetota bacterium]